MEILEFFGVLGPIWLGIAIGLVVGKLAVCLINATERVCQAWDARRAAAARQRLEETRRQRRPAGRPPSRFGSRPAGKSASATGV